MEARARRVLHLTADFGEYSQTFVADAIRELDGLGWEGWLATRSVRNRELFPFPPDERLLVLPPRARPRRLAEALTGRPPLSWSPEQVAQAVSRSEPVLVHAHFGWLGDDSVQIARAAAAPLIVSFHGADVSVWPRLPWWERPRRLRAGVEHRYTSVFPAIAHALVPSAVVEAQLRELGYQGPIDVLPSGVRMDAFALRPEPPPAPPLRLLFVGRLVRRKGVDVLLRALPAVRAELGDVRVDVCGDGAELTALERLAADLGVSEAVRFRGVCTREQVRDALNAAHALVLPSRTMPDGEIETLGVVILEALAAGVDVVATDSGGVPAAIPPERRHELAPEDDPAALGRALLTVLRDRSAAPRRAREGRAWIEENYSWERLATRIEAVYLRALSGSDRLAEAPSPRPLEG